MYSVLLIAPRPPARPPRADPLRQPWTSLRHRTTTTIARCPQKATEEVEQAQSSRAIRRRACMRHRRSAALLVVRLPSWMCLPLRPFPVPVMPRGLSLGCPWAPGPCMWTPGTGIHLVALLGTVPRPQVSLISASAFSPAFSHPESSTPASLDLSLSIPFFPESSLYTPLPQHCCAFIQEGRGGRTHLHVAGRTHTR